jgi:hypothetical protein
MAVLHYKAWRCNVSLSFQLSVLRGKTTLLSYRLRTVMGWQNGYLLIPVGVLRDKIEKANKTNINTNNCK